MAEIDRFWICHDPMKIDNSYAWLWEDPAIKDDEIRLAQLGPAPDVSWSIHGLVRIYRSQSEWEKERTKLYGNFADAKKDAEKRLAKARKHYEKELAQRGGKAKTASSVEQSVVERFKAANTNNQSRG